MSKHWQNVALASIMKQVERPEPVDAAREYRMLGAKWYALGLYVRETLLGSAIAASRVYRVEPGDFVYNRLFAWKGSFAVAGAEHAGCYVSNEFPCFNVDDDAVLPEYLWWYFKQEPVWRRVLGLSEGATPTSRNRLKEERFLSLTVPLPPLAAQRRIVDRLDFVISRLKCAAEARREALDLTPHAMRSMLRSLFDAPGDGTVGDYATVQSGYAFKSEWFSEDGTRLARNVNVGHGMLDWSDVARLPMERQQEFQRFALSEGDILVSLDRPLISTGVKVAMVRKEDLPCLLLQRVGRFQFKGQRLLPEYLFGWLHSPHFTGAIDPGRSNGVPHISQRDIERIPFCPPPIPVQERAVARWCELRALLSDVAQNVKQATAEAEALLPAVLNRAFAGAP